MPDAKRVLVIMPSSKTAERHTPQYWAKHFASYLKPLIGKVNGLEAVRAESLSGDLTHQGIMDIISTDLAIVDLTDFDANVVWQLGVRQSFKPSTLLIAENGTQVPFPMNPKAILYYDGEHFDNNTFEEKLQDALKNCSASPTGCDSPVLEVLGGRGALYDIMSREQNVRRVSGLQLEISVIEVLLGQVFENCTRNKTLREQNRADAKRMTTTPLKSAAVDFLLVNRYLDLDKAFYSTVYAYQNFLAAINGHLAAWETSDDEEEVEEWLLACKDSAYKRIIKLKEYLQRFR
jgi:hypothetical protein